MADRPRGALLTDIRPALMKKTIISINRDTLFTAFLSALKIDNLGSYAQKMLPLPAIQSTQATPGGLNLSSP
jgi:hypothetical protein